MELEKVSAYFIFAVVVEELGLVGALMILLIFSLLVWRGITLSLRAKDKFGKLLGLSLIHISTACPAFDVFR